VGRVIEKSEPCRWIEVRFDFELANGEGRLRKSDWCKVLIAEKHLVKGQTPLDHVLRAWYRSEADDSSQKMENPGDGRTPLPIILSGPLQDGERLATAEIDSKLGKLACEGVRGTLKLNSSRGDALPDIYQKCELENRMHAASPFGVVTSRWTLHSVNGTLVWHLTLVDIGENAASKMPDAK
jgi:hypothetical protein